MKKVFFILSSLLCSVVAMLWLLNESFINHSACNSRVSTSEYRYHFKISDVHKLYDFFILHTGSLEQIMATKTVPPIFTRSIPNGLKSLEMEEKKTLFIKMMLPIITKVNSEIKRERCILSGLDKKMKRHSSLTWKEKTYLNLLKKKYMVDSNNTEELLSRVDTIPTSLALAQGIIESGWGASRFARQGNALYGVHSSSQDSGKQMQSLRGNASVAAYDSILESTDQYIRLLNTGKAYNKLRCKRKELKSQGQHVSGTALTDTLSTYSEIGDTYVQIIKSVINNNQLEEFDSLHFQKDRPVVHINPRFETINQ